MSAGLLRTFLSENSINIRKFSFMKMLLKNVFCKMEAILSWPQCVNICVIAIWQWGMTEVACPPRNCQFMQWDQTLPWRGCHDWSALLRRRNKYRHGNRNPCQVCYIVCECVIQKKSFIIIGNQWWMQNLWKQRISWIIGYFQINIDFQYFEIEKRAL